MDQITYPTDPKVRRTYRWIEEQAFQHAHHVIVTTPGTADYYTKRYGRHLGAKIRVIANGYDEEVFPEGSNSNASQSQLNQQPILTLLHSGILYPKERDPRPFLRAIAQIRNTGDPRYKDVRIVFRGSTTSEYFTAMINDLNLQDVVSFPPALPYREALEEMLSADALLVFQADNCNTQIPAKVYEYLYAGRPVIGITDPDGDTGQLLANVGVRHVAKLEDEEAIVGLLLRSIDDLRAGTFALPDRAHVLTLSRRARTAELAALLNSVTAKNGLAPAIPLSP